MQRSNYISFTTAILAITASGSYPSDCNDLVFWNQGLQNVTINGVMVLAPGQAFTFAAYPGEMNIQGYDITFVNDRAAGCNLIVIRKEYMSVKPEKPGES